MNFLALHAPAMDGDSDADRDGPPRLSAYYFVSFVTAVVCYSEGRKDRINGYAPR